LNNAQAGDFPQVTSALGCRCHILITESINKKRLPQAAETAYNQQAQLQVRVNISMSRDHSLRDGTAPTEPGLDRLDSWKDIAAYLKRDVRTVHRWEAEQGLPVRRHLHKKRATVYAYKSELETWWNTRQSRPEGQDEEQESAAHSARPYYRSRVVVALSLILCALVAVAVFIARNRIWPTRASQTGKVKLVVLPFENQSGDPEQEYFSDGLTDEMTTELANLHPERLAVIARTSAMKYKHSEKGIDEIARELGVDYVLESSERRSNGRVWVTARLILASDQTTLWAQTYEREISDLPVVQSQVARSISREIALNLSPKQEARLANPRQLNPEAHEAYLKGLFFWGKFTPSGMNKSIEYFQQAIDKEPGYAQAYARMARAYGVLGNFGAIRPEQAYPRQTDAALKALELDPTLDEAHCALGWSKLFYDRDWAGARQEFERAVDLSPNSATAHQAYAMYFVSMGEFDQAMAEILRAQELDPVSLNIKADVGWFLFYARRTDESIAKLQEVLEMDPNFVMAHGFLADAYQQKGMFDKAIEESQKRIEVVDSSASRIALLGHAYAVADKKREAQLMLAKLKALARERYIPPYETALVYAGLGQKDEAFHRLEKAFQDRFWMMAFLKVDPRWDVLRSDPRFTDLLRRTGLAA
jgi:adenylate cyclase